MIEFTRVFKRYESFEALHDVNLLIGDGEYAYLTGHSGAGKSTLIKLIAAIERPTSGSLQVGGQDVGRLSARALPYLRRNIGLIFQDHKLLFDRTVFDNVMLPLAIAGFPPVEAARRVRAALDKVGLLAREKYNPVRLSGGEQQRLCIARAVVHRPAILLADEPTANLDTAYANDIMQLFKSFHQVGVTVLISTHDDSMLSRYPGRRIELDHGRVRA